MIRFVVASTALYSVLGACARTRARGAMSTTPRTMARSLVMLLRRGNAAGGGNPHESCHSLTPPRRRPPLRTPRHAVAAAPRNRASISWMVLHKWGEGFGRRGGESRFGCGCRPKTERTRKGAGRLPAATHKNTNRCSRAGPQRRTPTPRAASLACLVRALTARTSSTSMAGFWWSRPSAPRMTCARRFSRKPPAVATGPPSTSARS